MRAPIFEDSNDTAFYADLAGQSRLKSVKAGDSAIFNNTTYPLEVKSTQQRLIVLQNTSADANFPSIFHQTRNARSTMGISFNNIGERFCSQRMVIYKLMVLVSLDPLRLTVVTRILDYLRHTAQSWRP